MLKKKEYPLLLLQYKGFCLNLHFESTATALSLFCPNPYYTFKQVHKETTQRNSVKLKIGDQNEETVANVHRIIPGISIAT